jgi:predicted CXXCH cytochrome family protein
VTPAAVVSSNVARADYAGSKACEPCHADVYKRWAASPMRRMTRRLDATQIDGRFDGARVRFHDDAVTVEEHDGRRYMRVDSATHATSTLYKITKVVGGRYREDYVGVHVAGTGASDGVVGDPRDEPVLPLSWLRFDASWRYKGYSVMARERPRIERGRTWRQTCILCHNTAPLLTSLYDDLAGPGAKVYQGSVSDDLLPAARRWRFEVADAAALDAALGREIQLVTGHDATTHGARARLDEAIAATRETFGEEHLVEVGIGCEACHGGSREHVEHPDRRPSYAPTSPLFRATTHDGKPPTRADAVNHVCARCHTVLFSRYPFTWEGGARHASRKRASDAQGDLEAEGDAQLDASSARRAAEHAPGGSSINSGEARDYLLGHCAGAMTCTACHDPHAEDDRKKLDALATPQGNGVCLGCHAKLAGDAALAAHTHHAPTGEGSACASCHMPRKNTGLAYRLTRYHRIGSPTDAERAERDRPLECALCHADKSARDLVDTMLRWYGARFDRARAVALYGDADESAIDATLRLGKPHEQMTAAAVLGERGTAADAPKIVPLLASEYPLARHYAKAAIERLTGAPLAVDVDAPGADVVRDATRALAQPPTAIHVHPKE